ncbi:hypothetical protein EW145_g1318 [Phellinidium pouzarii]|uniref:Uncharacterized protein n=1 Tax=Phellinidium pouzarii TaxID=167371 RepID=A0A4S4LGQ2_9AGAM|nr:hypothetical protein EW145_g1318 [Phellinidium pouzarii]
MFNKALMVFVALAAANVAIAAPQLGGGLGGILGPILSELGLDATPAASLDVSPASLVSSAVGAVESGVNGVLGGILDGLSAAEPTSLSVSSVWEDDLVLTRAYPNSIL